MGVTNASKSVNVSATKIIKQFGGCDEECCYPYDAGSPACRCRSFRGGGQGFPAQGVRAVGEEQGEGGERQEIALLRDPLHLRGQEGDEGLPERGRVPGGEPVRGGLL